MFITMKLTATSMCQERCWLIWNRAPWILSEPHPMVSSLDQITLFMVNPEQVRELKKKFV